MTPDRVFFTCACHTHGIVLFPMDEVPDEYTPLFIEFWYYGKGDISFFDRLKAAWQFLRWGTCFQEEMVLNKEEALRLSDELRRVVSECK